MGGFKTSVPSNLAPEINWNLIKAWGVRHLKFEIVFDWLLVKQQASEYLCRRDR